MYYVACEVVLETFVITVHYCSDTEHLRLRNDLYCVGWGVKLYSLTDTEQWL